MSNPSAKLRWVDRCLSEAKGLRAEAEVASWVRRRGGDGEAARFRRKGNDLYRKGKLKG